MKHARWWFLAFLFIIAFVSCEFDSDKEFYKDIEKPEDILVGIDLAGVTPGEPIYIYENTRLYFSMNTSGKRLLGFEASVNGNYLSGISDSYMMIYKENLSKGSENVLKIKIQLKTDSGSLADIMNAEVYEGEFTFILVPVDNDFDVAVRNTQTDDKYLKLEWNRPSFEQLEIGGYEITFTDTRGNKQAVALDASATSFVDKDYVYGYRAYGITMKFAGEKIPDKTSYYNMNYSSITSDDVAFEFKDLESTKISWRPNKYRCRYYILHDRNDQAVAFTSFDTPEVYLPAPAFPAESGFYTVVIVPADMDISEVSYSSGGVEKFYEYKAPASPLKMAVKAYDISNKLLYGIQGRTVRVSDASGLQTLKSYDSPYFENLTSVSLSPKSDKLLVFIGYNGGLTGNILYLYDNKNDLSGTPKLIQSPAKDSRYGEVLLIDDNRLFIALSHDSSDSYSYHSLIDTNTGDIIATLQTNMYHFIDVSHDKERVAFYDKSQEQLVVYQIKEDGFELTQPLTVSHAPEGDHIYCTFNPNDSDQLIINSFSRNEFLIVGLATRESRLVEGEFITIDPFTERIYSYDKDHVSNSFVNVYEKGSYDQPVFRFKANKYGTVEAYNDFVMSYSSYVQIPKQIK